MNKKNQNITFEGRKNKYVSNINKKQNNFLYLLYKLKTTFYSHTHCMDSLPKWTQNPSTCKLEIDSGRYVASLIPRVPRPEKKSVAIALNPLTLR